MNNLGLVFLWLQLSLNNSGGACAVLNFSDDLLVLVRLHNLDDLRRSTLRNIVDDVSVLDTFRQDLLFNNCGGALRDVLDNSLVLNSLWLNLLNNIGRCALRLLNNNVSDLMSFWQVLLNDLSGGRC